MPNPKTSQGHQAHPPVPDPLMRPIAPAAPYPLDELGPILGPMAHTLQAAIEAPDALCAQSVLAATSLAVQGHADVRIAHEIKPVSLYLLTLADSGERKTSTDNVALRPHEEWERQKHQQYRLEDKAYGDQYAIYRKAYDGIVSDKKMTESEKRLALGQLTEPHAPLIPRLKADNPTYQALLRMLRQGLPSMGLFSNEGGKFLGSYSMSKDAMQQTIGGLADLWDAKPIMYDVVKEDIQLPLYGRRLSIHLSVQPELGFKLLGNRLAQHMGLLSRFLIAYPTSTIGTRFHKPSELDQDPNVQQYNSQISALLNKYLPWDSEEPGALKPRILTMTRPARDMWWTFHCEIEQHMAPDQNLAEMKDFANKMSQHAARLAAVFTVLESPEAFNIIQDIMERAIHVTQFYVGEAIRLFCVSTINPEIFKAQAVLDWLKKEHITKLYPAMLYHGSRRKPYRDKKAVMPVIDELVSHGALEWIENPTERDIDGAIRREAWRVV